MEQTSAYIPITTTYASILALMMVALAVWVTLGRAKTKIMFGDGGDEGMIKRTRAFGNFVEFIPMGIIVMMVVENASGMSVALHIMGVALIVGRILHTAGMNPANPLTVGRGVGAILTYAAIGVGALYALKLVLPGI